MARATLYVVASSFGGDCCRWILSFFEPFLETGGGAKEFGEDEPEARPPAGGGGGGGYGE